MFACRGIAESDAGSVWVRGYYNILKPPTTISISITHGCDIYCTGRVLNLPARSHTIAFQICNRKDLLSIEKKPHYGAIIAPIQLVKRISAYIRINLYNYRLGADGATVIEHIFVLLFCAWRECLRRF